MGKKRKRIILRDHAARYYPSDALSLEDLSYWIAFSRVLGIGPVRFALLLDFFHDDVAAAWRASPADLAAAGLDQKTVKSFIKQRASIDPPHELECLEKLKVRVITWKDATYPPLLRKIEYSPPVLYICGNLTEDDQRYSLGIVGTRKMSAYGRQVTEQFTRDLVKGNVTIVSGLALGIDTVAHTTALDAGGRTIAVMACGLDVIYPSGNLNLAKRIAESGQGALLTAFPLGVQPEAGNFPARNHIISGLSLGVLVTEAPQKSGALITAGSALTQGREVFAVPGNIYNSGASGTNKLIQDGAHPVLHVNDILMNLNLFMVPPQTETAKESPPAKRASKSRNRKTSLESPIMEYSQEPPDLVSIDPSLSAEERAIFALLGPEPTHIDELIRQSELSAPEVSATLTMLELKRLANPMGGMQYVRSAQK